MTDSYYIRRAVPGEEQLVREMVIRVKKEMPAEQQIWFSIDNLDEELRDFRQEKVLCYLAMERLESANGNGEELPVDNRNDIPAGLFFLEIPGLSPGASRTWTSEPPYGISGGGAEGSGVYSSYGNGSSGEPIQSQVL